MRFIWRSIESRTGPDMPVEDNTEKRVKETSIAINWMTIICIPVGLGLLGWFATEFDSMRVAQIHMADDIGTIKIEVGAHSSQLEYIWREITKQSKQHAEAQP